MVGLGRHAGLMARATSCAIPAGRQTGAAQMLMSRNAATLFAVACLTVAVRPAVAQTAVIVHRTSVVSDVKLDDLRRFFLGQGAMSPNGQQTLLVELTPMRTHFYKRLLGLSGDEVRRRWIGMVFRGDALALPFELGDATAVKKFVAEHPGAVAFVAAADVDDTIKVLRIDGKRPGDPTYPLK
jgi:hypothetical protein